MVAPGYNGPPINPYQRLSVANDPNRSALKYDLLTAQLDSHFAGQRLVFRLRLGQQLYPVAARTPDGAQCPAGDTHSRGQKRILALGLLPAAPARVAKDVDDRRPDIQASSVSEGSHLAGSTRIRMNRAHLFRNRAGHFVNVPVIEGGRKPDRRRVVRRVNVRLEPAH